MVIEKDCKYDSWLCLLLHDGSKEGLRVWGGCREEFGELSLVDVQGAWLELGLRVCGYDLSNGTYFLEHEFGLIYLFSL